jgi:ribosomal protein S18 acetylase RimI-like enzyme
MATFLRPIDESNYRDVLQLSVAPDQERFVATDNDQAIDFYRRNGFAATGETEGEEIVMERAV